MSPRVAEPPARTALPATGTRLAPQALARQPALSSDVPQFTRLAERLRPESRLHRMRARMRSATRTVKDASLTETAMLRPGSTPS